MTPSLSTVARAKVPRAARERLVTSALAIFEATGSFGATLDEIRGVAGVSVGALYHHFPDKAALYAAVYADSLAPFQEGFLKTLRSHAAARAGVEGAVRFYLTWVSTNRARAGFLLGPRPTGSALDDQNRLFFAEVRAWWKTHLHYGKVRDLPLDVLHALWLGPSHEYCRHWLAGHAKRFPTSIADALSEAAWSALSVH